MTASTLHLYYVGNWGSRADEYQVCLLSAAFGPSCCPGVEGCDDGQVVALGGSAVGRQLGTRSRCLSPLVGRGHKHRPPMCHSSYHNQHRAHAPAAGQDY